MATYAAKLRKTAIDNTTVRLKPDGTITAGSMEPYGKIYYVDGNRSTSGDGTTWLKAMTTLSEALAASHANIALSGYEHRNWAGRNTIFVKADSITENLVLFADKTDVIGVGAKDSYDMPCIVGNHVPTNGMSTRFFNVQFRGALAAGGDIITLASTSSGIVFNGCHFNGWSTTVSTGGIIAVASPGLRIENCKFLGGNSDAAIDLGAGNGNGTMITGNFIHATGDGITVASTFTCTNEQAFIDNNVIRAATICIDDDSDTFVVTNNTLISAADNDTIGNVIDSNAKLAAGNIVTGDSSTQTHPFAAVT